MISPVRAEFGVIVNGSATRTCITRTADVEDAEIRTIEGLAVGQRLHSVQRAWLEMSVPQCGHCQAGQIMSAVALLEKTPHPSDADITAAKENSLYRCGTYQRIRAAMHSAAEAA